MAEMLDTPGDARYRQPRKAALQKSTTMEWDDLRYVLAVHRSGTLAGAARTLRVSHVTVFRRVEAIEAALGVRLFDRKRQGYVATIAGEDIVARAAQIEDAVNTLERSVWRQDAEVHGTVRLTTTDTIGNTVLAPMLAALRQAHPDIVVELDVSLTVQNITKRDADIAIRHTAKPPEMLVGHVLTPVHYGVYGCQRDFGGRRRAPDLAAVPWVSPEDTPMDYRFIRWIRESGYEDRIVLRCGSFLALAHAVRAGVGVGIVSHFVAAEVGGLVPLTPTLAPLDLQYWILTHPELRQVARVTAVYAFLRKAFAALRPRFTQPAGGKPRRRTVPVLAS
jgi:DNA-binding transcriptional LysR family regulator